MNGKKAKALRRMVYGDKSKTNDAKLVCTKSNKKTAFCDPNSLRGRYLKVKDTVVKTKS